MSAIAEFDRRLLAQRTREGLASARSRGARLGRPPETGRRSTQYGAKHAAFPRGRLPGIFSEPPDLPSLQIFPRFSIRSGTKRGANRLSPDLCRITEFQVPRFNFNIRDGVSLSGKEGRTLPNTHAARIEAVRYAEAFLARHARAFRAANEWTLDVSDAEGSVLFSLALASYDPPKLEQARPPEADRRPSVNRYQDLAC